MAAQASSSPSSSPSPSSAIDFLTMCHRLKTTKRAGWVGREVQEPESIADHMYRMGLMALIASDIPGVNREKCMKIAIVHDIAEAIVGDITPSDGIPKQEKSRREREALQHMCELLGGGERAKEIKDLWMEYEENSSMEAKLVKDFDKVTCGISVLINLEFGKRNLSTLKSMHPYPVSQNSANFNTWDRMQTPEKRIKEVEMILQALEYENEQGKYLEEFFESTAEQGKYLEEFFESTAGKFQTDLGKAWALEVASRRRKQATS